MDLDKLDTTVWYRLTRNPQEFCGLIGCQQDPRILSVTELAHGGSCGFIKGELGDGGLNVLSIREVVGIDSTESLE